MKSVSGQLDHLTRLFNEVARPLLNGAGYYNVQAAISTSSHMTGLKDGISQSIVTFLNLNEFADEKVEPDTDWDYDNSTLPTLEDQISKQLAAFGLSSTQAIMVRSENAATENTDGLMAIPFLTDLGMHFGIEDPLGAGYGQLGEKVLEGVASTRTLYYREDELGSDYVRVHADVKEKLAALESQSQPEEGKLRFHVLPVSMGASLAGYSPRNARATALLSNRLPLGFVQIFCLLLGWPERLSAYEQRWMDCSGDQYNWGAGGAWARCPFVEFGDDGLELGADVAGYAGDGYGSPVASLGV